MRNFFQSTLVFHTSNWNAYLGTLSRVVVLKAGKLEHLLIKIYIYIYIS